MFSRILKKYIFRFIFAYLSHIYNLNNFELSFENFSSGLPGSDSAQTQYDPSLCQSIIQINLNAHNSFADIRKTAFHEFRHVMQYNHFSTKTILNYNILKNYYKKHPDPYCSVLAYIYCPLEIDARAFEMGEIKGTEWQIFHEIDKPNFRIGSNE